MDSCVAVPTPTAGVDGRECRCFRRGYPDRRFRRSVRTLCFCESGDIVTGLGVCRCDGVPLRRTALAVIRSVADLASVSLSGDEVHGRVRLSGFRLIPMVRAGEAV